MLLSLQSSRLQDKLNSIATIKILRDMNGDVQITNVTDDIGVLTIAGPKSKDLLATVTDSEVEFNFNISISINL